VINFFPEERHKQLLQDLSLNMRGIISQRLVPTIDGKRAAAIEVLLGTPRTQDLIKQGEVSAIKEIMEKSEAQGMQTFDMALLNLYKAGKISEEEALKNADSKNNLRLKITLGDEGNKKSDESSDDKSDENADKETTDASDKTDDNAENSETKPEKEEISLEPLMEEQEEEAPEQEVDEQFKGELMNLTTKNKVG